MIMDSYQGMKLRRRWNLKDMARNSVSEGGSSYNNFRTFIEAIKN